MRGRTQSYTPRPMSGHQLLRIAERPRSRQAFRAGPARAALVICAVVAAVLVGSLSSSAARGAPAAQTAPAMTNVTLADVSRQSGLAFRQGAFRFGVSPDPVAMMGSGVCWLDYDRDGWMDLFVVNSYSRATRAAGRRKAASHAARCSTTSRGSSSTSAPAPARTSRSGAPAASPQTSTRTGTPTSTW